MSETADVSTTLMPEAAEPATPLVSPAVRTLILGIDMSGRILQCDRHAPKFLGRSPGELLGADLGDLTTDGAEQQETLAGLIDAMRSGRDGTAMLSIKAEKGRITD